MSTNCPIESISMTLAFASKDWSLDKNDAWIYGIVAGWDDASFIELKALHGWTDATIEHLKRLREDCQKLRLKSK